MSVKAGSAAILAIIFLMGCESGESDEGDDGPHGRSCPCSVFRVSSVQDLRIMRVCDAMHQRDGRRLVPT